MPSKVTITEPHPTVAIGSYTHSGRGGAGNAHRADERAVLNFDEEFDRARVRDSATATHVGVGGAGNVFRKTGSSVSDGSSVRSSHSLTGNHSFWGRKSSSSARQ